MAQWATAHGAVTVDVIASSVDATSDDAATEMHTEPAGSGAAHDAEKDAHDPLDGLDAEHQRILARVSPLWARARNRHWYLPLRWATRSRATTRNLKTAPWGQYPGMGAEERSAAKASGEYAS